MLIRFFIETFKFTKNSNLFADPFEMAKFTTSSHGNPQLVDKAGYEYSKHKTVLSGARIYWRCIKNRNLKCKARMATENNCIAQWDFHIGQPKTK